ncbi:MAG: YkgJ family cysteine cluster protein [Gammaproteobacteria bacterium]
MPKQSALSDIKVEITPENKCGFCTNSLCCTYFTQQVETPRSKYDFEHLLWQISHGNVNVYKDEDGWYLLIRNPCTHLLADGRCAIYERRPQICRDYDNDFCEFDEPAEKGFELFFDGYDALHKYCRKRFKKWER